MKRIFLLTFSIGAAISVQAANATKERSCSQLGIESITTELSILKGNTLGLNIDMPEYDAQRRVELGDYRFLGYELHEILLPGLSMDTDFQALCSFSVRLIEGMSFSAPENKEHHWLMIETEKYMAKYNHYLLQIYSERKK